MKKTKLFFLLSLAAILPITGFKYSSSFEKKPCFAIGIANKKEKLACSRSELVIAEEIQIETSDISKRHSEIVQKLRNDYPASNYNAPTARIVPPGKVVIVYGFFSKNSSSCSNYTITYEIGKTFAEVEKIITDQKGKKGVDWEEKRRWPDVNKR